MKKLLINLLLLFVFSINTFADNAVKNHYYGYCAYEEQPSVKTAIGYEEEPSLLGLGALYTPDFLKHYVGDKVVGLRIAVMFDLEKVSVFLADNVNGKNFIEKEVSLKAGWNDVMFDEPTTIGEDNIFAGYSFQNLKEKNVVAIQSFGTTDEHGIYLSQFGGKYMKYSLGYGSNLMIQLIINGDENHFKDRMYVNYVKSDEYIKKGESLKATATVHNFGINNLENVTFEYSYNGEELQQKDIQTNIKPGQTADVALDLGVKDVTADFICNVIAVNGIELDRHFNYNMFTYLYNKSYSRKILQEQLGTENSTITPYAQSDLLYAMPGYQDKVVWIQHHVGFGEDKFTVEGSKEILFMFGNPATYNPAMILDRRIMKGPYTVPTFAIPWSERIQQLYDEELLRPAFASVDIAGRYDKGSRNLSVEVSGEIAEENLSKDNFLVTIVIVENNIMSDTQKGLEQLESQEYIHNNTVRAFVTSPCGDDVKWNGSSYTYENSITLDSKWKDKDIVVVAFVHKAMNKIDLSDCEIFNSQQALLEDIEKTGIEDVNSDDIKILVVNGSINVEGDYKSVSIYGADGCSYNNSSLTKGLYVVEVQTNSGKKIVKKLIIK